MEWQWPASVMHRNGFLKLVPEKNMYPFLTRQRTGSYRKSLRKQNKFADVAPTTEGWLLYGHTHQGIPDDTDPLSVNVGLDAWDFKPVSEQQILAWFTFRHADQSK